MTPPPRTSPPDPLSALRERLLAFARARAVPVEVSVKWGQPSFAPPKRHGTPVRIGLSAGRPTYFVHCGSPVVARFRDVAPEAECEGTRAFVPDGADDPCIDLFLSIAFSYRKTK